LTATLHARLPQHSAALTLDCEVDPQAIWEKQFIEEENVPTSVVKPALSGWTERRKFFG
jgi:hypothetical protein